MQNEEMAQCMHIAQDMYDLNIAGALGVKVSFERAGAHSNDADDVDAIWWYRLSLRKLNRELVHPVRPRVIMRFAPSSGSPLCFMRGRLGSIYPVEHL